MSNEIDALNANDRYNMSLAGIWAGSFQYGNEKTGKQVEKKIMEDIQLALGIE